MESVCRLYHSCITERCILDWAEWSNQLGRKQNVLECCKPNHMVNPMPWTIPDWAFAFLGAPVCPRKYLESIIYDSLRMSNHSQSWLLGWFIVVLWPHYSGIILRNHSSLYCCSWLLSTVIAAEPRPKWRCSFEKPMSCFRYPSSRKSTKQLKIAHVLQGVFLFPKHISCSPEASTMALLGTLSKCLIPVTVDGCEILQRMVESLKIMAFVPSIHHQTDGWNPINHGMETLSGWWFGTWMDYDFP